MSSLLTIQRGDRYNLSMRTLSCSKPAFSDPVRKAAHRPTATLDFNGCLGSTEQPLPVMRRPRPRSSGTRR